MGSDSDMPVMAKAADILDKLGIDYEMTIISAHREPDVFFEYAKSAEAKGFKVIIAGAGMAAHLPGMCAAIFPMPVIGIPMHTTSLGGRDSLYSIVQMPSGIPVATVAINGGANAGLLAAKILATSDEALLAKLKGEYPDKFLWIELGLQTIHEETAHYIRRGYPLSCFEKACTNLKTLKIPFIVHTILGLPGETDRQVLETMKYLNHIAPFGIKLQLLHILKNTDLAEDYEKGIFEALTPEHYLDLLVSCLAHLSPDIVIHRVTGDGPKDLLIAPKWSLDKRKVLNSLHHRMKEQGIRQGDLYEAINKDKH